MQFGGTPADGQYWIVTLTGTTTGTTLSVDAFMDEVFGKLRDGQIESVGPNNEQALLDAMGSKVVYHEVTGGETPTQVVKSLADQITALTGYTANMSAGITYKLAGTVAQGSAWALTLAETGRLLGEHEASVSRHLSATRKTIRRDVERRLAESGLAREEITQCFASVAEDAGPLDLDRLLSSASGARNSEKNVQGEEASTFAPSVGIGRKRQ